MEWPAALVEAASPAPTDLKMQGTWVWANVKGDRHACGTTWAALVESTLVSPVHKLWGGERDAADTPMPVA